jgi:hypothetical protein
MAHDYTLRRVGKHALFFAPQWPADGPEACAHMAARTGGKTRHSGNVGAALGICAGALWRPEPGELVVVPTARNLQ